MQENVGTIDRIARSIVGPGLIALGYKAWGGDEGRIPGLLAIVGGAVLVESAITKVCPVNALLGIDTRQFDKPRQSKGQKEFSSTRGDEIQEFINAEEPMMR